MRDHPRLDREQTIEELLINFLNLPALALSTTGAHAIAAVIGVLLLTYFEVVLTEIVPKNISIDIPVKMLLFTVTPCTTSTCYFTPSCGCLTPRPTGLSAWLG